MIKNNKKVFDRLADLYNAIFLTLVFSSEIIKILHDEVIGVRGTRGIKSKGTLESCLERPFMRIYGHEVFPVIFMKAGKLLHCIAGPFHPFIDGNKRTALLTTSLFLHVNGYTFEFPDDVVDFMLLIAEGSDQEHKTNIEMD